MQTILIADDETFIRESIGLFLRNNGYRVLEAKTGIEGLAAVRGNKIDLVISDIFMPEMDGLAMVSAILKAVPEMNVLIMSGGGGVADTETLDFMFASSKGLGNIQTIQKPVEMQQLLDIIKGIQNNRPDRGFDESFDRR